MTAEYTADVAVLMPKITDERRFSIRYAGLEEELTKLAVSNCFVEAHTSYDAANDQFIDYFGTNLQRSGMPVRPEVIRDLTMTLDPKPLYSQTGMRLVHEPATNHFIADKTNLLAAMPEEHPESMVINEKGLEMAFDSIRARKILIKPTTGMLSQGIQVLSTPTGAKLDPGKYIAQEFIDTSNGMPEFNIQGVHNLRVISIDSTPIGALARVNTSDGPILKDDVYGSFVGPDELSETTRRIVDKVHSVLRAQPGDGKNVIAVDVMRGVGINGEVREVLCEVNRRPMRISKWDYSGKHNNLNAFSVREIAMRWDKAEAAMLAGLVAVGNAA